MQSPEAVPAEKLQNPSNRGKNVTTTIHSIKQPTEKKTHLTFTLTEDSTGCGSTGGTVEEEEARIESTSERC